MWFCLVFKGKPKGKYLFVSSNLKQDETPMRGMLFFMLVIFLWLAESVSTLSHYVMGFLSEAGVEREKGKPPILSVPNVEVFIGLSTWAMDRPF